jgi:hypothetical protein
MCLDSLLKRSGVGTANCRNSLSCLEERERRHGRHTGMFRCFLNTRESAVLSCNDAFEMQYGHANDHLVRIDVDLDEYSV